MPSVRTQVYLSTEQRQRIDMIQRREGITLAEVVRRALEQYFGKRAPDWSEVVGDTYGAVPDFKIPDRGEWDRGHDG